LQHPRLYQLLLLLLHLRLIQQQQAWFSSSVLAGQTANSASI
jgi:hypothetical protein